MAMQRPRVQINMAMTLDGKITSAEREYPKLTKPYDRVNMDRIRAQNDAVLVGAQTLRADNPNLHVRTAEMRDYRKQLGHDRGLLKIAISASLQLDWGRIFSDDPDGGGLLVATVDDSPAEIRDRLLERGIEVWTIGSGQVDLSELLRRLHQRGVERLLVEGGGELNWEFVRLDLVDEFFVTLAPSLLGGRDAPTIVGGAGLPMADRRELSLVDVHREGDELYLHYAVRR